MKPWHSAWWPKIVKCAERGGHSASEIIEKVSLGHAMGWPVDGGFLVLERTEDDFIRIWLCAGRDVRSWWRDAEREVSMLAREVGCVGLKLEGRRGWRRILPHWTPISDEDLILMLENVS